MLPNKKETMNSKNKTSNTAVFLRLLHAKRVCFSYFFLK